MKKRKILVLSVGIMIIAATYVLLGVVCFSTVALNSGLSSIELNIVYMVFLCNLLPIIPQEIMLLKSVYNLIFHRPRASAKVRYIVAAVIVSSVLIFECLCFIDIISYNGIFPTDYDGNGIAVVLLFTQWPVVLLTGILTSVNSDEETQ